MRLFPWALAGIVVSGLAASSTWASFELERPGARATGMAGAFTAVADDADALYYNPAGLVDVPYETISAEYSRLLTGLESDTLSENRLAYVQPLKNLGCLGLAWHNRSLVGVYQENVITADLGFALDKDENYKMGAGLKILQAGYLDGESLDANVDVFGPSSTLMAITVDVGAKVELGEGFSLGVSAANLTQPDVSLRGGYSLPAHLRLGGAYALEDGVVALDAQYYGGYQRYAAGTEYWWFERLLATRAGYALGDTGAMEITAGMSLKLQFEEWAPQLDYAFVQPLGEFSGAGGSHRINLSLIIGAAPLDPGTLLGRELKAKGDEALKQGRWEEALDNYEQAAEYLPKDSEMAAKIETLRVQQERQSEIRLHLKQGNEFQKNGSYQNALGSYEKALALEPGNAEAVRQIAAVKEIMDRMTATQRQQQEQKERFAAERARQAALQTAKEALTTALRSLEKARRNSEIRRLLGVELNRLEKQWGKANQLWRSGEAERAEVGAQTVAAEVEKLYRKIPRKQAREKREKRLTEATKREVEDTEALTPGGASVAVPAPVEPVLEKAAPPAEVKPTRSPADEAQRKRARGAYGRAIKMMLDIDKLQGQRYFANEYAGLQSEISRIKTLINSEDYTGAVDNAESLYPKLDALKARCQEKKKASEVMPTNW